VRKLLIIFVAVFLAILAAAAVIGGSLYVTNTFNTWERAWRYCEAQVSAYYAENAVLERAISELQKTIRAMDVIVLAKMEDDPKSPENKLMDIVKHTLDNMSKIDLFERQAIALLEHKPFGLPLTSEERNTLETLRKDVALGDERKLTRNCNQP
jgi:hypothetical protein